MESSSDEGRFAAPQPSSAQPQPNLKQAQSSEFPLCLQLAKIFVPVDVVCRGAKGWTGAPQMCCVFSPFPGEGWPAQHCCQSFCHGSLDSLGQRPQMNSERIKGDKGRVNTKHLKPHSPIFKFSIYFSQCKLSVEGKR